MRTDKTTHSPLILAPMVLFAIWLSGCANAQTIEFVKPAKKPTLTQILDSYLEANIEDTSPGMAILVVKNGDISYVGTKGMANNHTALSIQSDTGFRLGSISKAFTALAVMQLYEQQRIMLDDSILQYLPEFSSTWQKITIHHLLSHRSGIPDFSNDFGIESWPDGVTNRNIVDYFSTHDNLEFQPGTRGEYSNTGYVLLAEIVSRLSGVRFADYMEDNLFRPLAMNDSYVADEHSIPGCNEPSDFAAYPGLFGLNFDETDSRPACNEALNYAEYSRLFGLYFYVTGSSGVVSSLDDMAVFMDALLRGSIVKIETLELMLEPHTLGLFPGSDYGYGLMVDPAGADAFAHTGRNDGFVTWMLVNRDNGLQLVILGNGGAPTGDHGYLTTQVDQFYGHPDR